MAIFFEILKYTLPSLIVFVTAYYLLKMLLDNYQRVQAQLLRSEAVKVTLPIRLQAYERLMLLCDRMALENTLLRVRMPGMTVGGLRAAMSIAIQQEFDHNSSQQLYVSEVLWRIITVARDETLGLVSRSAEGLDPEGPDSLLVDRILQVLADEEYRSPLHTAMSAIRTEAGKLF